MTEETITISLGLYKSLLHDSAFLTALEMTGVDNWEGYDEAVWVFQENAETND